MTLDGGVIVRGCIKWQAVNEEGGFQMPSQSRRSFRPGQALFYFVLLNLYPVVFVLLVVDILNR